MNRLIEIADTSLLLKHTSRLAQWLEQAPHSVVCMLTLTGFSKISNVLCQLCHWSGLITLYHACPQHLTSLNSGTVCEAVNVTVIRLGSSVKVTDTLEALTDQQLGGVSPEVSCHGYVHTV